jgi:hypothetical protein
MEICEGCDKVIDMHEKEGDYIYRASEQDKIAHPLCNDCLLSEKQVARVERILSAIAKAEGQL